VKSRTFGSGELWRTRYRDAVPAVGRSQGTAQTKAWANSRDAGELLGVTARLHPQMRTCIEALGVGDGNPRWVPDSLVIRASSDDPRPLWGELMSGPELRLRLALMGWAQGLDLAALSDGLDGWEAVLGVEQVRKRAVRTKGARDDQYDLPRALTALREKALASSPVNINPRRTLREESYGPHVPSGLEKKYEHYPEASLDERYARLGWSVRPPNAPHTSVEQGLLSQGWHLVAPPLVLGWMVALPLLHSPKGRAKLLGERHLGLKAGFQAADRARYFLKLGRHSPDLATLTLQRNILWALAELEVVPPTITDVGIPIQTLLVGMQDGDECCVLISGDHLRLWYRTAQGWDREPAVTTSLHSAERRFSMATLGNDAAKLDGFHAAGLQVPLTLRDLTLHTFSAAPWRFPAPAWERRTGLDARFVIPTRFLDANGDRWPTAGFTRE
jgi:hypothetical protein